MEHQHKTVQRTFDSLTHKELISLMRKHRTHARLGFIFDPIFEVEEVAKRPQSKYNLKVSYVMKRD